MKSLKIKGLLFAFGFKKIKIQDPILLSCTDGMGTKLNVAIGINQLQYLGFDLCSNV